MGMKTDAALQQALREAPINVAAAEYLERRPDGILALVAKGGSAWNGISELR